jgi:hypothetical protein
MSVLSPTRARSRRWSGAALALACLTGVAVLLRGVIPTAAAYPGAVDHDCPADGSCESVIQATDGNTYYAGNLGGGHGYVVTVGADGQPTGTMEVVASANQVALAQANPGRRLALWGPDMSQTGIFIAGSSSDNPVNTVNVNGSGYVEYAAGGPQARAQLAIQVIGGDGQVYNSARFNREDPKLQSPFKDYMQGAAALNTAASRLRSLLSGIAGVTTVAAATLISGVASKTFTETNTITAAAALGALGVNGVVQVYNAWRDVDTARNNLINLYNNLNAAAGRGTLPIPMVAFGGIGAQSVSHNNYHSFRLP